MPEAPRMQGNRTIVPAQQRTEVLPPLRLQELRDGPQGSLVFDYFEGKVLLHEEHECSYAKTL